MAIHNEVVDAYCALKAAQNRLHDEVTNRFFIGDLVEWRHRSPKGYTTQKGEILEIYPGHDGFTCRFDVRNLKTGSVVSKTLDSLLSDVC